MIDNDMLELLEFITYRNSQALKEIAIDIERIKEGLERIKPDQVYRNQFYIDLINPRLDRLMAHLDLRDKFIVNQIHEVKNRLRNKKDDSHRMV